MNFIPIRNPAELAQPYAEQMVINGNFDSFESVSAEESQVLSTLEKEAEAAGMLQQKYFVNSGRTVILPAKLEDESVTRFEFNDGLSFSGDLLTLVR